MPTKRQLSKLRESQFEFPETRRDDDPMRRVPVNPSYRMGYSLEVTYHTDKNFIVRLKAMIERTLCYVNAEIDNQKLNEFMDIIEREAEKHLFEKRVNKTDG